MRELESVHEEVTRALIDLRGELNRNLVNLKGRTVALSRKFASALAMRFDLNKIEDPFKNSLPEDYLPDPKSVIGKMWIGFEIVAVDAQKGVEFRGCHGDE